MTCAYPTFSGASGSMMPHETGAVATLIMIDSFALLCAAYRAIPRRDALGFGLAGHRQWVELPVLLAEQLDRQHAIPAAGLRRAEDVVERQHAVAGVEPVAVEDVGLGDVLDGVDMQHRQ